MRFLILGWLVGRSKKRKKNSQEVWEKEAWKPKIIAVKPGNNKTVTKSTQTQYGWKYDGWCPSKKQKGYEIYYINVYAWQCCYNANFLD